MPTPFRRLTFPIVLLKVSPLVARLVSVPDDLSLEELHEVLQLNLSGLNFRGLDWFGRLGK